MAGTPGFLTDSKGTSHERFGLRQLVGGLQQSGEVVEVCGDLGMVLAEAGFSDGQGAAIERLGE